jgi:transposase InsO family protein
MERQYSGNRIEPPLLSQPSWSGPFCSQPFLEIRSRQIDIVLKWQISYSGDESGLTLNDFLLQTEDLRRPAGLSHEGLRDVIIHLLEGPALTWYRAFNEEYPTWEELKSGLRKTFLPYDYEHYLRQDIERRVQGENERFSVFLASMEMMFKSLSRPPPEAEKIEILRRNMRPDLGKRMAHCDFKTVGQIVNIMRQVERTDYVQQRRANPSAEPMEPAFFTPSAWTSARSHTTRCVIEKVDSGENTEETEVSVVERTRSKDQTTETLADSCCGKKKLHFGKRRRNGLSGELPFLENSSPPKQEKLDIDGREKQSVKRRKNALKSKNKTKDQDKSRIPADHEYQDFNCSSLTQTDKRPHILVQVYGCQMRGLLDSGAECTVLGGDGFGLIEKMSLSTRVAKGTVKTADGTRHSVVAACDLPYVFQGQCKLVKTLIVPSFPFKLILGIDFWKNFGIEVSIGGKKIRFVDSALQVLEMELEEEDEETEPQIELSEKQRADLDQVLGTFPTSTDGHIGLTTILKHSINTNNQFPPKQRFYPVSPTVLKEIDKELDRMLKLGVIERSESPSSNPLVVVRKATGKVRLCLDSRKLNAITVKDAYPLPLINDILGRLTGTRYLSSIDLKDAFWQIELDEEARPKTAFTVPARGLFQFKRMPFGLCNAAQSLSRLMHRVIGNDLEPRVFAYLDDIVIATDSFSDHLDCLRLVANRLREAGLTISVEKSKFCVESLRYLGFLIDGTGLHPDPDKVSAIVDYPRPRNIREIRRFLGMTGWYHRFIPGYAGLACPLTDLLKQKNQITWTAAAQDSFDRLRNFLITAPILSTPRFDEPFAIQCDASDRALGAVLTQGEGVNERVIAFLSKKFTGPQRKYAATEKECLAVLVAVRKFRQYVEGTRFTVITDCAALKWLSQFNDATNGRLCRWALQLQSYDFEIIHRKGTSNLVPDALSRIEVGEVEAVTNGKDQGEWLRRIREDLEIESKPDYKEVDGKIYKRIFDAHRPDLQWKLAVDVDDRDQILRNVHDAPTSGHMGFLKTLKRLQEDYFWPGMSRDVRQHVKACEVCKRSKSSNLGRRGLMGQPKPAHRPWQVISVDFVGPLTRSRSGKRFILVVTDAYTKMVVAEALHDSTTKKLTGFLEGQVFLKHSVPEIVISDNGPQFISKPFLKLLSDYKVKHWTNSVYHPQHNPTERVNQVIGNCLRCYVGEDQRDWDLNLPKVISAINTSHHEATGFTPYFLNYGRNMQLTGEPVRGNDNDSDDEPVGSHLKEVHDKVQKNLQKAYEKAAKYYNLRSRPIRFQVGQRAWRRNFVISDASKQISAKLAPKKVPGFIVRKLGSTTYEFKDEQTGRVAKYSVEDLFPD